MGQRKRLLTQACALAGVVAVVAGCGDSSSDKSASTTKGAATTAASTSAAAPAPAGPAGDPIKVGMICSCSGAQATVVGSTSKVAQAWANSVNAAGGINGHPVKLIVKDDGLNPATSLKQAKELVEQEHIVAMVGEVSLADAAWADYIQKKGIPVVGGATVEPAFLSHPDFFPSGSQVVPVTVGAVAQAKEAGKKSVRILYCAESPDCAQLVGLGTVAGKLSGIKVTSAKIAATSPNYTAPCLAMKSDGTDALFAALNPPVVTRLVADCQRQGVKPKLVGLITASSNTWLKDPNFEGIALAGTNANPFDPSLPAVKEMQDALEKYSPGLVSSDQYSYDAVFAWAGGKLFEAAAKEAALTPTSTGADVKKGLYALKDETLGGLSAPLNFVKDKPSFVPCYFTQTITDGKFASAGDNKPTCLSTEQATALGKALAAG